MPKSSSLVMHFVSVIVPGRTGFISDNFFMDSERRTVTTFSKRKHSCGDLGERDISKHVTLYGWAERTRMDKFLLLRDAHGSTQVIIMMSLIKSACDIDKLISNEITLIELSWP